VFQHLIASRPARESAAQGSTASLVVHGAILTLAIFAGAQAEPDLYATKPSRVIPIPTFAPPQELPPAPARAARQPAAVEPAPAATELPPIPSEVPTSLPDPGTTTWTPTISVTPSTGVALPGAPPGPATLFTGHTSGEPLGAAEVDIPAALLPRSPLPRYPDIVRPQRLEGSGRVRFVVGTDGRVEMSSVRILESTHPAFAESVRATLPRMRFSPARVGNERVRQMVELPLGFRIGP
jgi:protein TonB